MKKLGWITILLILIIWLLLATSINNVIVLPNPIEVISRMLQDATTLNFYQTIFVTIIRMLKGLFIAAFLGIGLAILSGVNKHFRELFYPVEMILKTIPNVSYIIISLIWLGSENSVILVCFLVLFPIFYSNTLKGITSIDSTLKDAITIYPVTFSYRILHVYLPLVNNYLLAGFKTAIGLGFKVATMAEILGRVQNGIGFKIDYCRVNLDMIGVFSWTIWMIIIASMIDLGFFLSIKIRNKVTK